MASPLRIDLVPSGSVIAGGVGVAVDIGASRRAAVLSLDVVGLTPADTPTDVPMLTVVIETAQGPSGPWAPAGQVTFTEPGRSGLTVGELSRYVRASWSLLELDFAAFGVGGVAHQIYAEAEDITRFSVPERSIAEIPLGDRVDACIAATDEADGYIGGAYILPLVAWGDDLRAKVADLAAALLFKRRGSDAQGVDVVVFDARDKAIEWLNRLANGRLKPPGMIDSTPETFEGGSVVASRPKRGW